MAGNALSGKQKVETASIEMTGIQSLIDQFAADKPLDNISMLVCVTPTIETGVFLCALNQLGAKIAACSDNAFATDDDVVAFLRSEGIAIFAKSNMTEDEYFGSMAEAIKLVKDAATIHIVDDGCDITNYIVGQCPDIFDRVKIITEQTTCGINTLKHLYYDVKINAPAININDCFSKRWFDNYIGIQQSLVHALSMAGISIPGKRITVFGYGAVAKGAVRALSALGAHMSIVEENILYLMQAEMDGYTPISTVDALYNSDIILTATGCDKTVSGSMIERFARDGLILGNIGHGTDEYEVKYLLDYSRKKELNPHIDEFTLKDGRKVYSLCKGALVNFLAGGGNMPKIMSLTFTLTILAHLQVARSERYDVGLHKLDRALEIDCAKRNFPHLSELLYHLNEDQKRQLML